MDKKRYVRPEVSVFSIADTDIIMTSNQEVNGTDEIVDVRNLGWFN